MTLVPYLGFDGTCADAFRFYARVLHGEIGMLMTYGESPEADRVGPDQRDRIMHAHMTVGGESLMGGDAPKGNYSRPAGFCVSIDVPEEAEAERIFGELSEGGHVQMPLGETFWAKRFGMFIDRYGTPWMVNCAKPM
jgi:PhnB protein